MSKKLPAILGLIFALPTGLFLLILMNQSPSTATAEAQKIQPKYFRHLGTHVEGSNSVFRVFCDVGRSNLIYSYVVAAGNSASSNLVVVKDGCKGEK